MKKTILCYVLLAVIVFSSAAQRFDVQGYEASVRPVTISLHFRKNLISLSHIDLFRTLEREMGEKILGSRFPLASGSGFFISDTGHLVTNNHVVDTNSVGINVSRIMYSYLSKIHDEYGDEFSEKEFSDFVEAVTQIFIEGEIDRYVLMPDGNEYKLNLIDADESRDLALLQLSDPAKTIPIRFIESGEMDRVRDVFSIGYPLPETLKQYFEEVTSTVSSGIVSAKRDRVMDDYSGRKIQTLQHTASINPGNSGGPLVTGTGLVVGVNSSLLTDANNIYFAVSMEEVKDWLEENSMADLFVTGSALQMASTTEATHHIEALFTSTPDGADVYIGDDYIGTTPFTTKLAGPREYEVLVTKKGYLDSIDHAYIRDEEGLSFAFSLTAGGEIVFERELPPTIQVTAKGERETRTFSDNDEVLLPDGEWEIGFEGPISNGETQTISMAGAEQRIDPVLFLKPMEVNLLALEPESEVLLLPSRDPLSLTGNTVSLFYGKNELLVRTPKYRDLVFSIVPDNKKTSFNIGVEYTRSNEQIFKQNLGWGLGCLFGGLALNGIGLLFQLTTLPYTLADTYDTYAFIKYFSFGTMVAGWVSMGVGTVGTIRAMAYRKRSDDPIRREYNYADGN